MTRTRLSVFLLAFLSLLGTRAFAQQPMAQFLGTDDQTQGLWLGKYGSDGYVIANGATNNPSYAVVTPQNQSNYTWSANTTDPRALQTGTGTAQAATCWYTTASFSLDVNITDGNAHAVSLYLLDWDSNDLRAETIKVTDYATGKVLDTRSFGYMTFGKYVSWNVAGHVVFTVNLSAGVNAVVSGIFFGNVPSYPPPPPVAVSNFPGLNINHLAINNPGYQLTPWPTITFSALRNWDEGITWADLEPSRGTYNWTNFDTIINMAASHNVDILYTFGNTPPWALPANIPIASISRASNVVTVTTSAPHGLYYLTPYGAHQSVVTISGVSDSSFNGTNIPITGTPSSTTFTFAQSGADASSSGGIYSAACNYGCAEAPYNLADWQNFVTQVATRAAGRIKYWEVWNEPNLDNFWKGDKATLVTMAQQARSSIKSINSNAVIVSPDTTGISDTGDLCAYNGDWCGTRWQSEWLSLGGKNYVDVVAFHNYPGNMYNSAPEQAVGQVRLEKAVLAANGVSNLPIWDTESSWGQDSSYSTFDVQTAFLARHILIQASAGVQRSFWYSYDNWLWGTLLWTSDQPGPGGFVGLAPAGTAYNVLAGFLQGATFTAPCSALTTDYTTWTCPMVLSNGKAAKAVWNINGASTYAVDSGFGHYTDMTGQVNHISGSTAPISTIPIVLTH